MVYSFYTYFKHPADTQRLLLYAWCKYQYKSNNNRKYITHYYCSPNWRTILFTFQYDHKCWAIQTHGRSPKTQLMHVKSLLHLLPPYTTHLPPQCNHITKTSQHIKSHVDKVHCQEYLHRFQGIYEADLYWRCWSRPYSRASDSDHTETVCYESKSCSTSDMHQSCTLPQLGQKSIKSQVSVLSGLTRVQQKVHQRGNINCCWLWEAYESILCY